MHARVQRRTVEQIVDAVSLVPLLDDPLPQTVEQLPNIVQFFAALSPVPEKFVEVPKILPHGVPPRRLCRHAAGGTAGGGANDCFLVFVQRTAEQNVDIPVLGCGGRSAGLQGFLPGQSSTSGTHF